MKKLISERIKRVVDGFFKQEEKIVVGVSGGADSMTLLHCLMSSEKKFELIVAHFNHNLRGSESDDDESFVRNFCFENNLKFVCKSLNILQIARKNKVSVEFAGRVERYRFFEQFGITIATAHTLSDRIETMFFNMARGCSLKGLCSIPSQRGKIKRPLISFTRHDVESYCFENMLSYRNDSSNFSLKYSRNRIRHRVIPEFRSLNFNFEVSVAKMLNGLEQDEFYFFGIVEKILKNGLVEQGLQVKNLALKPFSIKSRVVFEFLKKSGVEPNFKIVSSVLDLIQKGVGRLGISQNRMIVCKGGLLCVKKMKEAKKFDFVFPQLVEFSYKNLYFIKTKISYFNYFLNKLPCLFLFKFDYDKIKGLVHLRNRQNGDRIRLRNRPTKKLKCLMQEARIDLQRRDEVVVLADDRGPFWVCGFGLDERVLVDDKTKNLIMVFEKS